MRESTHAGYPMVGDRLKEELEKKRIRLERGKPGPREESGSTPESPGQLALIE
jgi:hypothetical protein